MSKLLPEAKAYVTAVVRNMQIPEIMDALDLANVNKNELYGRIKEEKLDPATTLVEAYVNCVEIRDIDFDWQFREELPDEIKKLWFNIGNLWEGD